MKCEQENTSKMEVVKIVENVIVWRILGNFEVCLPQAQSRKSS